jgi:arginine exporter protein ArgO
MYENQNEITIEQRLKRMERDLFHIKAMLIIMFTVMIISFCPFSGFLLGVFRIMLYILIFGGLLYLLTYLLEMYFMRKSGDTEKKFEQDTLADMKPKDK